jgi:aspartyl-tRNA(Asn)/glutamyl-tRNA(Gln) amidotransferase subunit A
VLERIEQLEPQLNAFITVLADTAVEEARAAERDLAAGRWRGPLHGVPITLKDLYDTAGIRTSAGARITAHRVPDRDSTVAERLRAAGAILVGKCNMFEFAYGHVHPDFGPSRNPWNLAHTTGGSSSGSGAAVAAGLGQASMGSDTGGSIRLPAAFCGIVGLKPTYGLVPRTGVVALSWSLDHCGPMARSAWDCAAMLQAVAGHDPADPGSAARPTPDYLAEIDGGVAGLRLGVPRSWLDGVAEPIASAFSDVLERFRELGAEIRDVEPPDGLALALTNLTIITAEAASFHEPWFRERPGDYSEAVRQRLEDGLTMRAADLLRAQRARRTLVDQMRAAMSELDLIVHPAAPILPPTIEEIVTALPGGGSGDSLLRRGRFTSPYTLTGLPAISVPAGFADGGLPIGIQLIGHAWSDALVLRAARAYQSVTDWHTRRPALSPDSD